MAYGDVGRFRVNRIELVSVSLSKEICAIV